jgi:serine/threonine protein kinase/DNA-binding NarL/FixJ family response regulator
MSLMFEPPDRLQERYHLLESLGRGGMAQVYRAHDETLNRDVAIKFLLPQRLVSEESSERFLREARIIARLSHPQIMQLYDVGRQDRWHYLVLEHIKGQNLRQRLIENGGKLPPQETLGIMRGVLGGLAYAHAQGVVHRDIKPENIMLTTDQQVKVMDFGLALGEGDQRLTQEDVIVGTIFYMAPEILMGGNADVRGDLYALGVVWYELLTGRPPFAGEDMRAVVSQILNVPVVYPTEHIPANLHKILEKLLAKEPTQRYAQAAQVMDDLPSSKPIELPAESSSDVLLRYAAQEDQSAAIEAERRRLARLLQDQAIEPLTLLLQQAALFENTQPQARMAVSVLSSLARQLMQQLNHLSNHLQPDVLERLGLEAALEALTTQETQSTGVQVRFIAERLRERLPSALELALFRSVQEALERAIRQARASQVTVKLESHGQQVSLSVSDNGYVALAGSILPLTRPRLEQLGVALQSQVLDNGGFAVMLTCTLPRPIELTTREMEVLQALAQGLSNKQIARQLGVSPRTVNFHLDNLYMKLGVNSRTEALIEALRRGWIRSDLFK